MKPDHYPSITGIHISVPGRICLFGEHQDYLGLPVIASAIDLRVSLNAVPREDLKMVFDLRDIGIVETFDPNIENPYRHDRDYLPSAMNILRQEGLSWNQGYDVTVKSDIPINSGASSSSALQVAYCAFLLAAAGDCRACDPVKVARFAYHSEVLEFNSPGGMMDHFSTACGGVIWLDSKEPFDMIDLGNIPGEFLLVDSGVPKDTNGVLGNIRSRVEKMSVNFPSLNGNRDVESLAREHQISDEQLPWLEANIRNMILTENAREMFLNSFDSDTFGNMLKNHHLQLSENLGVSHPVIDKMLTLGNSNGAFGGKINGSGGGGSFFMYAGEDGIALKKIFTDQGFRCWRVRSDQGLRVVSNIATQESKVS